MKQVLMVALGGAFGAIARYKLGGMVLHHSLQWKFPLSTLAVNVSGCFLAGIVAGLIVRHELPGSDARLFLLTGLLGGFTTFSAFGLETVHLLQRQEVVLAFLNIAASVLAGVVAVWLGMRLLA